MRKLKDSRRPPPKAPGRSARQPPPMGSDGNGTAAALPGGPCGSWSSWAGSRVSIAAHKKTSGSSDPTTEARRWFFTRMTAKRRRPYHKHPVRSGEHTRGHLSPNIWAINYGANNSLTTKIFVKKVQSPPLFCLTCDTLYRIFLIVNSHTQPERIE